MVRTPSGTHAHALPCPLPPPRPARRRLEANVRAALVAGPGCLLLGADYRQMELRLMAHFRWASGWAPAGASLLRCERRHSVATPRPTLPCLPAVQPRQGAAAAAGAGRRRRPRRICPPGGALAPRQRSGPGTGLQGGSSWSSGRPDSKLAKVEHLWVREQRTPEQCSRTALICLSSHQVTPADREAAKQCAYALIYGQGKSSAMARSCLPIKPRGC